MNPRTIALASYVTLGGASLLLAADALDAGRTGGVLLLGGGLLILGSTAWAARRSHDSIPDVFGPQLYVTVVAALAYAAGAVAIAL